MWQTNFFFQSALFIPDLPEFVRVSDWFPQSSELVSVLTFFQSQLPSHNPKNQGQATLSELEAKLVDSYMGPWEGMPRPLCSCFQTRGCSPGGKSRKYWMAQGLTKSIPKTQVILYLLLQEPLLLLNFGQPLEQFWDLLIWKVGWPWRLRLWLWASCGWLQVEKVKGRCITSHIQAFYYWHNSVHLQNNPISTKQANHLSRVSSIHRHRCCI